MSAVRLYHPPSLYQALKAEGFVLPDECGDVTLDLPVDGIVQLVVRINITERNVEQIGRALVRLGKGHRDENIPSAD